MNIVQYPAAVWIENGIYSAVLPDLPGVITEADSLEALKLSIREAASGWMACELDDGRAIPKPGRIEDHASEADLQGCTWALVYIDVPQQASEAQIALHS